MTLAPAMAAQQMLIACRSLAVDSTKCNTAPMLFGHKVLIKPIRLLQSEDVHSAMPTSSTQQRRLNVQRAEG